MSFREAAGKLYNEMADLRRERDAARAERDAAVGREQVLRVALAALKPKVGHLLGRCTYISESGRLEEARRRCDDDCPAQIIDRALTPPTPGVPTCAIEWCGRRAPGPGLWVSRNGRAFCSCACADASEATPGVPVEPPFAKFLCINPLGCIREPICAESCALLGAPRTPLGGTTPWPPKCATCSDRRYIQVTCGDDFSATESKPCPACHAPVTPLAPEEKP